MNELLTLASDYIERMSNPAYGPGVNEDYGDRFAAMLQSKEFQTSFDHDLSEVSDRGTLSAYGWLWLLEYAKSRQIQLREELLVGLFEQWSNVFVRADIVDVATQLDESPQYHLAQASLGEFPNPFLRKVLRAATSSPEEAPSSDNEKRFEEPPRPQEPSTTLAESTLVALLQVGTPISLAAARALLNYHWVGQEQLENYFSTLYDALDAETQAVWAQEVKAPREYGR